MTGFVLLNYFLLFDDVADSFDAFLNRVKGESGLCILRLSMLFSISLTKELLLCSSLFPEADGPPSSLFFTMNFLSDSRIDSFTSTFIFSLPISCEL